MKQPSLVFSIREYDYLAEELAGIAALERGELERSVFPDGEHYLRLRSEVNDRDVVVVGGTISDEATLEIYDIASSIVEYGAATLTLIVPWYGYATMDRASHAGEAVMAKHRARFFSSIPPAKLGNQILLLDIHSEGIPHYFEGGIHPVHVYGKAVIEPLVRELGGDSFVIGSTDAGRAKWVESLANDLGVPAAFAYKRRLGPSATQATAVNTHLDGETVVLYDDMIRTGGSLIGAARAYREAGAGRITAVATHGVFAGDAVARLQDCGLFAAIGVTNSHPHAVELSDRGVIVRSVAPVFLPCLR